MWRRFALRLPYQQVLARTGAAVACAGCALASRHDGSDAAQSFSLSFFAEQDETKVPAAETGAGALPVVRQIGKYLLGRTLGEGAFAVVKHATDAETGEEYACKLVQKGKTDAEMLKKEVAVLEVAGRHQHIVSLIDRFDAPPDAWALVFDLVSGGEVFDRMCNLGTYSEREAAVVVWQVAKALQHLHYRGIVHRDLKPENLLLVSSAADADVKVCDFGLAEFIGADAPALTERKGTVAYMAPEVLRGEAYGVEVDLWALGVITFILLSGYHPFDPLGDADDAEVERRAHTLEYTFDAPEFRHVSPEAKSLIASLLVTDPQRRASVADILLHPWVGGDAASATPLPEATTSKLREFNDARRLCAQRSERRRSSRARRAPAPQAVRGWAGRAARRATRCRPRRSASSRRPSRRTTSTATARSTSQS